MRPDAWLLWSTQAQREHLGEECPGLGVDGFGALGRFAPLDQLFVTTEALALSEVASEQFN